MLALYEIRNSREIQVKKREKLFKGKDHRENTIEVREVYKEKRMREKRRQWGKDKMKENDKDQNYKNEWEDFLMNEREKGDSIEITEYRWQYRDNGIKVTIQR